MDTVIKCEPCREFVVSVRSSNGVGGVSYVINMSRRREEAHNPLNQSNPLETNHTPVGKAL